MKNVSLKNHMQTH